VKLELSLGISLFAATLAHASTPQSTSATSVTDITWIQKELAAKQFTSIEAFLQALPQDYRDHYALMYESHSLQQATPAEPRVISFGTDGSLILAFNSGDPALRGSDTVELIQFNPAQTNYSFYEISKSSTGKLELSSQTTKCEACHQSDDPRPNWQAYDNWPGAYGSLDDQLASVPTEQTNYASFVKTAANNPRYAVLTSIAATTPTPSEPIEFTGAPNDDLTNSVAQWNYMRAARLVRATKDYSSYKYAILGSASCVSQFASFFPVNHPLPANWILPGNEVDTWVSAFIYLFQSRNIDWTPWTTQFAGVNSTYFDGNPFCAGYTYGEDLVANIVRQDPELQAYAEVSDDNSSGYHRSPLSIDPDDCDALAKMSVKALTALNDPRADF
jgi:hypothetical protein